MLHPCALFSTIIWIAATFNPFGFVHCHLHSGVSVWSPVSALHGLHDLVGGEGLLHHLVLDHLVDALGRCDCHLLG